jgi:hypothetical protein
MFSPVALLSLLCCTTIGLFGDRGAISSNSITGDSDSGIREDFGITVAESGWVYATGMVRDTSLFFQILLDYNNLAAHLIKPNRVFFCYWSNQTLAHLSIFLLFSISSSASHSRHQHQLILAAQPTPSASLASAFSSPQLEALELHFHLHSLCFSSSESSQELELALSSHSHLLLSTIPPPATAAQHF